MNDDNNRLCNMENHNPHKAHKKKNSYKAISLSKYVKLRQLSNFILIVYLLAVFFFYKNGMIYELKLPFLGCLFSFKNTNLIPQKEFYSLFVMVVLLVVGSGGKH